MERKDGKKDIIERMGRIVHDNMRKVRRDSEVLVWVTFFHFPSTHIKLPMSRRNEHLKCFSAIYFLSVLFEHFCFVSHKFLNIVLSP